MQRLALPRIDMQLLGLQSERLEL